MATRMQQRRGTAAQWISTNSGNGPILNAGEIGYETDTNKFKIGDGTNHWINLDYFIDANSTVNPSFGSSITFEGATDNAFETTVSVTDPTADRTITLPDATGTVALTSNIPSSTTALSEGTNLYFTDERAQDAIGNSVGTGLSYNDSTGAISVTANTYDAYGAASASQTNAETTASGYVTTHANLTAAHGATGAVVGTTNTQTLTNKTLTSPVINTPTGITKTDVGLSSVDNTTDAAKPISTATQTALDAKLASATAASTYAPIASPTFTGTVSGITKSMVGLGSVDNTADSAKPVSTAQQTALDLKAPLASPTFTGTVSLDTGVNLVFEGATADAHETTLTVTDPTADRTITFPNATGTVVLADGSGNVTVSGDLTVSGTTTIINSTVLEVQNEVKFEGLTANDFETSLKVVDPTADRVITFPDATGTVAILDTTQTLTNKTINLNSNTLTGTKSNFNAAMSDADFATLDGTETLTNKTINLTSNTVTATLAQLNTAVSDADVASLAGSETLTNKTLTSPKVNEAVALLATSTELNVLDGITSSTAELNILDGVTSSTAELNILDGVTATTAEINKLAGVTATSAEINTLAGLTSTAAELNILDGATLSVTELNYVDGVTSSIQTQLNGKQATVANVSDVEIGYLDGVTSSIQTQLDAKSTASKTETLTNKTLTSPVINTPTGITKSDVGLANVDNTTDANKPVSTAGQTALDLKANLAGPTFTGTVVLPSTTSIGDVSATEIGYLDGVTSSVQTQLTARLPLAGGTMTGALTLSGAPTVDLHATTKAYVDNVVAGLNFHQPVRVATTANITLSGTQTIDGVSVIAGDRVLVKDQTTQTQNGIYVVSASAWSRAADADNTPDGELKGGDFTLVLEGTIGSGYGYVCSNTSAITIGTTNVTYVAFNAAKAISAGSGLTESTPGTLDIATGGVTSAMIADGTIVDGDINASAAIAQSKISGLSTSLSEKAPLASPTFTGTVTVAASGIAFTDGTQTKEGVPSRTPIIQKTASYTLSALTERDSLIEVASASGTTITIPTNAAVAYPVGTSIDILQTSTGQVTIAGDAGVTVNSTPGLKLRTQWSTATLFKRATNTWVVYGDLTA